MRDKTHIESMGNTDPLKKITVVDHSGKFATPNVAYGVFAYDTKNNITAICGRSLKVVDLTDKHNESGYFQAWVDGYQNDGLTHNEAVKNALVFAEQKIRSVATSTEVLKIDLNDLLVQKGKSSELIVSAVPEKVSVETPPAIQKSIKKIMIDEAHNLPCFIRVVVCYKCGCAAYNDQWKTACECDPLCAKHEMPVHATLTELVAGKRPEKSKTRAHSLRLFNGKLK